MVQTSTAHHIILANTKDHGTELIPFASAIGRVLAENITTDRDLPPYNRSTMDGIAISYVAFQQGIRTFRIRATMAAGDTPVDIKQPEECIEIMTGAALPGTADTIVRYEDVTIQDGIATINLDVIKQGQNIHPKGKDKKQGEIVVTAPCVIDAATIGMAASVGQAQLLVKKVPTVIIISTGDELVDVTARPTPYQVRKSNSYTIAAVLQQHGITADTLHITDDLAVTKERIKDCLGEYDVIIVSGGISMGKFDFVPQALEELQVTKLFHKVQQRPGKPFWFGIHHQSDTRVFAFPGNPVSGFMCLHRYLLPWLHQSLGLPPQEPVFAILDADVTFTPALQYFMQVSLRISPQAQLIATPIQGNGSGDFSNLLEANAFMELSAEKDNFKKGELYRVWPFKPII